MSKKKGKIPDEVRHVLDRATPKMAHAEDPAWYVEQCLIVISWFKEMFKRVGSDDKKLAGEARDGLQTLWLDGLIELTALARDKERRAEKWAGKLLAITGYWIESNDEELCKVNEAYRQEQSELRKSKFLRSDLWSPRSKGSPLYKAIHSELRCIMFYRGELVLPMAQFYVQGLPKGRRPIPEEYHPFMKLPPLSPTTLSKWEPELWVLVSKKYPEKYPDLLVNLQAGAKRNRKQPGDGKIKWKGIEPYSPTIKEFRPQFRQHFGSIAKRLGLYFPPPK